MKSSGTLYWYGLNSGPLMETTLTGAYNFLYFFFNGQIVYRREFQHGGNVVDTYVLDRLGNTNIVSGYSGAWDQSDYYPFGGERPYYSNVGNHYKFTGKERDTESGLDNFGARFMASSMGRFMSPDPGNAGASIDTPQSWNGYSYALNNPVNFIDPSGLLCVDSNGNGMLDKNGQVIPIDECDGAGGTWIDPQYTLVTVQSMPSPESGSGIDWSWTGSFLNSFFTTNPLPTAIRSFGEGGCNRILVETMGEDIKDLLPTPVPTGSDFGPSDLKEIAPKAAAAAAIVRAGFYSGYRGLSQPMKSSVFRALRSQSVSAAESVEEKVPELAILYVAGHGLLNQGLAAAHGDCH